MHNNSLFIRLLYSPNIIPTSYAEWGVFDENRILFNDTIYTSKINEVKKDYARLIQKNLPSNIILCLPDSLCFHKKLTVNKGQKKHLNSVIPFMAEEFIAQNLDDLHFSYYFNTISNTVNIVAISHTQIQWLLTLLNDQKISPNQILCESQILYQKNIKNETSIIIENQSIMILKDNQHFQINHNLLNIVFENNFLAEKKSNQDIQKILVTYSNNPLKLEQEKLDNLIKLANEKGIKVEINTINKSILESLFDKSDLSTQLVNLRSGKYQCQTKLQKKKRGIKIFSLAVGAGLLTQLCFTLFQGFNYHKRVQQLVTLNAQSYLTLFPKDQSIKTALLKNNDTINLKSRLENRIKQPNNGLRKKNIFFSVLKQISQYDFDQQNLKIQSISFIHKNNNFNLKIIGKNEQNISDYIEKIKTNELRIIDKITRANDSFIAQITIQGTE